MRRGHLYDTKELAGVAFAVVWRRPDPTPLGQRTIWATTTQTIDHYPVALDERSGLVDMAGFNGQTGDIFDGTSGRFLRGTPVPGDLEAIADDATGRVLVVVGHPRASPGGPVAGATALCVLDGMTGQLRRVLPLGASTHARLYLDEPAHRALALLDGSPHVPRPDPWGWVPAWLRAPALRAPASTTASADRPGTIRRDRRVGRRYGGPVAQGQGLIGHEGRVQRTPDRACRRWVKEAVGEGPHMATVVA